MVCLNDAQYQELIARYQLAHQDHGFRDLGERAESEVMVDGQPTKRVLRRGCQVDVVINDGWGKFSRHPGCVAALIEVDRIPYSVVVVESKDERKKEFRVPFTQVIETCPTPHE